MKKLLLITLALVVGTTLAYSQGTIILSIYSPIVFTNGASVGEGTGPTSGPNGSYYYEVLDMTQTAWNALTSDQQWAAYNLIINPSAVSLWTDSFASGYTISLHVGGIGATPHLGLAVNNWPSPGTSSAYGGDGQTPDYYTIVGWSANEGTSWTTVELELNGTDLWPVTGAGSWFGQTSVAFNYAGGGTSANPPSAVSLWATSAVTGLAGSGGLTGLTLEPIPEPDVMGLAGLGGLSLLLFRRRK